MSDKSYVSLEQKKCQVCGKDYDTDAILLDTRMRDRFEHHTVTGWGMCPEDQAKFNEGFIALVEVDPTKSSDTHKSTMKQEDAHRTGKVAHLRRTAAARVFDVEIPETCPMTFVEPGVIDMLLEMQAS